MKRFVEFVLGALSLDDRGRRAVDETLLDWEHEAAVARSLLGRMVCDLRAAASMIRVLALISIADIARLPRSPVLLRIGLWLVVPFVVMTAWTDRSGFPLTYVTLVAMAFCSWVLLSMPVALFLSASPQTRLPQPFLGLAFASLVIMAITAGWLQPALNHEFREQVYESRGGQGKLVLERGFSELTLRELLSVRRDDDLRARAHRLQLANLKLALIAACPGFVFLASQVSTLSRWRRRTYAVAVPLFYVALWGVIGFAPRGATKIGLYWLPLAFAILATLGLALERRSATAQPAARSL